MGYLQRYLVRPHHLYPELEFRVGLCAALGAEKRPVAADVACEVMLMLGLVLPLLTVRLEFAFVFLFKAMFSAGSS